MTKLAHEMAKPRVLLSGHLPPPMGGIATFYQALLGSSLGEKVDLSFVETSSQSRSLASSGAATYRNAISAIHDCCRFARSVRAHHPQVTHIATSTGLSFLKHGLCVLIASFYHSIVLLHLHCGFSSLYSDRPAIWKWLVRQVFRMTSGLVVLSSEWDQIRAIMPACRVYHLPNAIDLAPYESVARGRFAQPVDGSGLRVLYLGYVGRAKGTFDLAEAARLLQSRGIGVSFDLVGDSWTPHEWEQLREKIADMGIGASVRLHSSVTGPDKLSFFRNADVFIHPSYHEGMPISVIEAMACGLAIVATRVGGLPDLVTDGVNGILVEPGRPDELAVALESLSADRNLCRRMGEKGYQLAVEGYDMETRVTDLVKIYQKALDVDGQPARDDHSVA